MAPKGDNRRKDMAQQSNFKHESLQSSLTTDLTEQSVQEHVQDDVICDSKDDSNDYEPSQIQAKEDLMIYEKEIGVEIEVKDKVIDDLKGFGRLNSEGALESVAKAETIEFQGDLRGVVENGSILNCGDAMENVEKVEVMDTELQNDFLADDSVCNHGSILEEMIQGDVNENSAMQENSSLNVGVRKGSQDGENEYGPKGKCYSQIIMDKGAEENLVEKATSAVPLEKTEVEEIEAYVQCVDTFSAKKVCDVAIDDQQKTDCEDSREIQKVEDNVDDRDEDNGLHKYIHNYVIKSKKQNDLEVFVGGIGKEVVEEDLIDVFGMFGEIKSIRIVSVPVTKKKNGFAFIQYATLEQVNNVLSKQADGIKVKDSAVKVSRSQCNDILYMRNICKTWKQEQVKTVYLAGLSDSWDEEMVIEICKQYGEIVTVKLSKSLSTKRKDFGFVTFTSRESTLACVEGINAAQIDDGKVKIKANISKPILRGHQNQGTCGGFKVKNQNQKLIESGSSIKIAESFKKKDTVKSEGIKKLEKFVVGKRGETLSKSKGIGKPRETNSTFRDREGETPKKEKINHKRKNLSSNIDGHAKRDNYQSKRPKNQPRGSSTLCCFNNSTYRILSAYSMFHRYEVAHNPQNF